MLPSAETTEVVAKGRPGALRTLVEKLGVRRRATFDAEARPDRMSSRDEEVGKKIVERFEGRTDRLAYRSVTFFHPETVPLPARTARRLRRLPGEGAGHHHTVRKMTEKYDPDPSSDRPEESIAKRTFFCAQGRIVVRYHYATGRVTRRIDTHDSTEEAVAAAADARRSSRTVGVPLPDSLLANADAEQQCFDAMRRNQGARDRKEQC